MRRMTTTKQIELIENLSKGLLPVTVYTEGIHLKASGNDDIVIFNDNGDFTVENANQFSFDGPISANRFYGNSINDVESSGNYIELNDGDNQLSISGQSVYISDTSGNSIQINPQNFDINMGAQGTIRYNNEANDTGLSFENEDTGVRPIALTFEDLILLEIPTSDPHVAKALWNDNGVLKISAGS